MVRNVLRLCSGSSEGQGGVELWINLQQPIAFAETTKEPIYLKRTDVVITHAGAHLLIARVTNFAIDLLVVVAHAPHCGHDDGSRSNWWSTLRETVTAQQQSSTHTFLLCDANAKTGRANGVTVFEFDDEENPNTEDFRVTLATLALGLPATTPTHTGEQATWTHPSGEWESRIDYVAVPQSLLAGCTHSCVMGDFDLATLHSDHRAVGVQLNWTSHGQTPPRAPKPRRCKQVPRSHIKHAPVGRFLQTHYRSSWCQDIGSQVDTLNEVIHQSLLSDGGRTERPKKHFITEELWQLRREKLEAGKAARVQHAVLQLSNHESVRAAHNRIAVRLQDAGFPALQPKQDPGSPLQEHYGCLTCGLVCRSKGGEGAHMFRRHGRVAAVRRLMHGTQCAACLKEYYTTGKLQAHLHHSAACRSQLLSQGALFNPQPGIGSTVGNAQARDHDGVLPVRRAQGPVREPLGPGPLIDLPDQDEEFVDHALELLVDVRTIEEVIAAIRATVLRVPISWTTFRPTITCLCERLGPDEAEHMEIPLDVLVVTLQSLCRPGAWDLFQADAPASRRQQASLPELEKHFIALAEDPRLCEHVLSACRVPGHFGRDRYVLHAFSGRRRPGDVEWFLNALQSTNPDVTLHIVSVDIIIHAELGDVSRERTRLTWFHGAHHGWIVSFLAGPPCETWSHARANVLDPQESGSKHGPRVIRAQDHPWGMESLRVREIKQILVSNILMEFTLELAILMVLCGGSGLVEHPAPPQDPQAPSIWRQPLMHFICQLPRTTWMQIDQGRLGAVSKKPTGLMAIRLPTLSSHITDWALTPHNPKATSIGRDQQGRFLTAPLKEYPPALGGAMALGIHDAVYRTPVTQNPVSERFRELCSAMKADFGSHIGPDYAHT
eukprot:Skav228922  [mRNA]  locus=scaffold3800:51887:56753:- [translate_table: standard]